MRLAWVHSRPLHTRCSAHHTPMSPGLPMQVEVVTQAQAPVGLLPRRIGVFAPAVSVSVTNSSGPISPSASVAVNVSAGPAAQLALNASASADAEFSKDSDIDTTPDIDLDFEPVEAASPKGVSPPPSCPVACHAMQHATLWRCICITAHNLCLGCGSPACWLCRT